MDFLNMAYSPLALVAAALVGFIAGRLTASSRTPKDRQETRELERSLDERVRELPPALAAAVRADLGSGNVIAAVKRVRGATGCGLKEAHDIVQRMQG